MKKTLLLTIWLVAMTSLMMSQSFGQSASASLFGVVRSADGETLPGANVVIRNESTGFTTGAVTNLEGRFQINQIPLGGPYSVKASFVGEGSLEKKGYQLNLGDQVRVDFDLRDGDGTLETIVISADDYAPNRVSPIGSGTRLGMTEIKFMPTNGRSFQDLANLAPTTSPGGSLAIGGTRVSSTAITLDGGNQRFMMNGGLISQYTVSMEAIREYEVTTNEYSVMEGRQGGGAINVVTKSGTNEMSGSAFFFNRNQALTASEDYIGRPINDFNTNQYGFSLGGPIIKDKLHFFTALDFEDRSEPFAIIDVRDSQTERLEQITQQSLDRFINILEQRYGLDPNRQQTGLFNVRPSNRTVFARLDWQINDIHKLTFRNNFFWGENEFVIGGDATALADSRGDIKIFGANSQLALRSTFSSKLTNELKVQYLRAQRDFPARSFAPRGLVGIESFQEDGTRLFRQFQFGGNRIAPEEQGEQQLQLINTTYLQTGKIFWTFGTDNMVTFTNTLNTNEQGGLFQFASLDALEEGTAFQYSRLVPNNPDGRYAPKLRQTALDLSAFVQAETNLTNKLSALFGLRWDATVFLTAPEFNPLVQNELGRRTDVVARDYNNIQPRFQLTYDFNEDQRNVLKFGIGGYSANIVHWAQLSNILQSGTILTDLLLTGENVPSPDFPRFIADPAAVPGVPAGGTGRSPYINLIGENFEAPYTWKGNLAYRRFITNEFYLGANAYFARTINNYRYQDLNLREDFAFRLANENNRGVYASPDQITNVNLNNPGVVVYPINPSVVNANPNLGRVLELNGDSDIWQRGVIFETGYVFRKGGSITGTFTVNRTEDNNSYNCCIARTSVLTAIVDDPRDLAANRGGANTDFRHKIVLFGTSPAFKNMRISARYVGQSGLPWTPLVFGDIVGDGAGLLINANKRAFIFNPETIRSNPNATPFENIIAEGMETVLANPDNIARELLIGNLGEIAPRNEIYNPFWHNVDVRFTFNIDNSIINGMGKGNLELIAEVFNFTNLLNSEWGGAPTVPGGNQVLLQTLGLDPIATQQGTPQYAYRVNPTFGETVRANPPYQVQIGARYTF
ncbi:TonB-dependent receptor [Mongoliibacter ruber]|uniref:Carboxypeptidase family protein n=1 Tax=Mongoliibacter ruber TaxID=1750599 RepID=A0A2T0WVT1_9BACT|nr:TonB-dependent receptor [Mongoliibacter ruber]PRY90777.1 carboxypeptidase family protein [Mongoliibacter ruber]